MNKKILVVDDDPFIRTALAKMLRVRGIDVIEASNGLLARKLFATSKQDVALIVADVQMPVMNGLEFLEQVREESLVPFVLFTGLSDVIESKSAFEMGATDFLTKPVDREVINKILSLFNESEAEKKSPLESGRPPSETSYTPQDYSKVQIETLFASPTVPFDIYLRLSETKFVKIARKGETPPRHRLEFYRDGKVDVFYVLNSDLKKQVS